MGILSLLGTFLAAIPGIGGIVTSITSTVFNAKVQMLAARTGASRDVAVQTVAAASSDYHAHIAMMQALTGPLLWLVVMMGLPVAAYEFKVVVYDTMLGWGSTPAIGGEVATWMNTIVNWLFGSSTVLAVGSMAMKAISSAKE